MSEREARVTQPTTDRPIFDEAAWLLGLVAAHHNGELGHDPNDSCWRRVYAFLADGARADRQPEPPSQFRDAWIDLETRHDMAEAYYKTLETHLRQHGCEHDFGEVANEDGTVPGLAASPPPPDLSELLALSDALDAEWCERSKSGLLCERHDRALFPTLSPYCNGWAAQVNALVRAALGRATLATTGEPQP